MVKKICVIGGGLAGVHRGIEVSPEKMDTV